MFYKSNCCKVIINVGYPYYEYMLNLLTNCGFDSIINEFNDIHNARLSFYCRKNDLSLIWANIKNKISEFERKYYEDFDYYIRVEDIVEEPKLSAFNEVDFMQSYNNTLIYLNNSDPDHAPKVVDIERLLPVKLIGNEFIINQYSYMESIKGSLMILDSFEKDDKIKKIIMYSKNAHPIQSYALKYSYDKKVSVIHSVSGIFDALSAISFYNSDDTVLFIELDEYKENIFDIIKYALYNGLKHIVISGIFNMYERIYTNILDSIPIYKNDIHYIYTNRWESIIIGDYNKEIYEEISGNGR